MRRAASTTPPCRPAIDLGQICSGPLSGPEAPGRIVTFSDKLMQFGGIEPRRHRRPSDLKSVAVHHRDHQAEFAQRAPSTMMGKAGLGAPELTSGGSNAQTFTVHYRGRYGTRSKIAARETWRGEGCAATKPRDKRWRA